MAGSGCAHIGCLRQRVISLTQANMLLERDKKVEVYLGSDVCNDLKRDRVEDEIRVLAADFEFRST